MILARVVGNVVATQKNKDLVGKKLMLVLPIDTYGSPAGTELIAVDAVGAGIGDLVVVLAEGGSARQILKEKNPLAPIDLIIAGIVDEMVSEKGTLRL
jgi:ethanolamine utilization protein EutN